MSTPEDDSMLFSPRKKRDVRYIVRNVEDVIHQAQRSVRRNAPQLVDRPMELVRRYPLAVGAIAYLAFLAFIAAQYSRSHRTHHE